MALKPLTAAARQVTPQQQAIIDDVGTGALPADDDDFLACYRGCNAG
jgi:hypothetical protein